MMAFKTYPISSTLTKRQAKSFVNSIIRDDFQKIIASN